MAENEIRIPVVIEMTSTKETNNKPQEVADVPTGTTKEAKSDQWDSVINYHFALSASKKILTAVGKTQAGKYLKFTGKAIGWGAAIGKGQYVAAIADMCLDAVEYALQQITALKSTNTQNNNTNINNIRLGKTIIGQNYYATKNGMNKITYHEN